MSGVRHPVIERFERERVIAVVRVEESAVVPAVLTAIAGGGILALEITLTTPDAVRWIEEFATDAMLCLGAGTVLDANDARRAIDAGARFVVSPVFDPGIVAVARAAGVCVIPGAFTPTEIHAAWRAGADAVKLFPMPADGAGYLRAVRAPLRDVPLIPSSGVTPETLPSLLAAGAAAVAVGSWLVDPGLIAARAFDEISRRAARLCEAARAAGRAG